MEAVLVRASVAGGSTVVQAHSSGGQLHIRAILAERLSVGTAADSSWKGLRQSGFYRSQVESLGPSRLLWNNSSSSSSNDQPRRISEEALDHSGLNNCESFDRSVREQDVDTCDVELHTPKSFAKFLRHYPVGDLKLVSQACYLSNLAYIIGDIKGDELEKDHRLQLVTSSIQQENAATTAQFNKTLMAPATAYALAATATYLQSRKSSTEWTNGTFRGARAGGTNTEQQQAPLETLSRAVDQEMASAMSKFMDSPDPCSVASTIAGDDAEPSASNASSACGWFVCDEPTTATRFFSIQGSETMASWKANLQFQPTQFEDCTLGVMVHKGVYELAKSLYDQMLPLVQSHMAAYGKRARVSFTGHSLGGSLAVLLSLMFRCRGVVPVSALNPVYTFGAPSVLNGGNKLLKRLGFLPRHIQSVVISRDLVPRIFASDIPEQIVEVLKRVNQHFRNLPTFVNQRQLYATTGQLLILQPEAQQAPGHPLLPSGSGLYVLSTPIGTTKHHRHVTETSKTSESSESSDDVQAAEAAFLNSPHPLDIMSDPSAYGAEGAISRDHDPRSYRKAVNHVLKQTVRCLQRRKRIERWHLDERIIMADRFDVPSPPPLSPVDTSKRPKRKTADSCIMFFPYDSGFFNRTSSTGACNYLQINRNHVNRMSCVS